MWTQFFKQICFHFNFLKLINNWTQKGKFINGKCLQKCKRTNKFWFFDISAFWPLKNKNPNKIKNYKLLIGLFTIFWQIIRKNWSEITVRFWAPKMATLKQPQNMDTLYNIKKYFKNASHWVHMDFHKKILSQ